MDKKRLLKIAKRVNAGIKLKDEEQAKSLIKEFEKLLPSMGVNSKSSNASLYEANSDFKSIGHSVSLYSNGKMDLKELEKETSKEISEVKRIAKEMEDNSKTMKKVLDLINKIF